MDGKPDRFPAHEYRLSALNLLMVEIAIGHLTGYGPTYNLAIATNHSRIRQAYRIV